MLGERSQLVQLLSRMNMTVVQTSHRKNTSYPTYSHITVLLSCVFPGSDPAPMAECWDMLGSQWLELGDPKPSFWFRAYVKNGVKMGMAMGRVFFHSYRYHIQFLNILETYWIIVTIKEHNFGPFQLVSSSLALMPLMYRWFPEWEIRLYHFPNSLVISARLCCRSPSPPAPPATTGTGRFWGTNLRSSWVKAKTLRILRNCPECLRLWKTAKHLV